MSKFPAVAACAALFVTAMAQPAAAEPFVYAKPGLTMDEVLVQEDACHAQMKLPRANAPIPVTGNVYGMAAGAFVTGILSGVQQSKAEAAYMDSCMRTHGFARLSLSAEETAEFQTLKGKEPQTAWVNRFLAGDIGPRVAAALKPAVEPLGRAPAEPFTVGGVRLDPGALHLAEGPVAAGQPLLTGQASHRRTATLSERFELMKMLDMRVDEGAVLHLVENRPADAKDEASSMWCGPIVNRTIWGTQLTQQGCFVSTFDGFRWTFGSKAQPWLSAGDIGAFPGGTMKGGDFKLRESETDLLGPMDLALSVRKIGKDSVELEALATREGKSVRFWSRKLPFDAQGKAELPFWTHKLILSRTAKGVTAALGADGDGRGWLEAGAAG